MSPKRNNAVTIVAVAVLAAGAAAAITFAISRSDVADLEAQLAERDARIDRLEESVQDLGAAPSETVTAPVANEPAEPADSDSSEPSPKKAIRYAFVTAATESGGVISLTLDYAQFLTGEAAAEAARAAGDEPPPNDYWVANTDTRTRTFPVEPTARFVIALNAPQDTRTLKAGEFLDAFVNDRYGARNAGYWVTLLGGEVIGAEEQWLP